MKKIALAYMFFLFVFTTLHAQDVIGFWKTIDDKTGKQESLVAIYEYEGKGYGRIVLTYDDEGNVSDSIEAPRKRAPGVKGNPYYSGLDIIWDMEKKGQKYKDGNILDPLRGKVYDAEMWLENGNLIVRGKILFFGKNQQWVRAQDHDFPPNFRKPNLNAMVPKIPVTR